jgi:hypothetical protein
MPGGTKTTFGIVSVHAHSADCDDGPCGWRQLDLFEEVTDGGLEEAEATQSKTHPLSVERARSAS